MPLAPIGVIGAGNIGRTLGVGWLRAGYPITFGVRDPAADSAHQTRSQLGVGARVLAIAALAYGQKRGRNLAFKVLERATGPGGPVAQA